MFLFCSHGVNPSFQAVLDPDPGGFRVLWGRPTEGEVSDLGRGLLSVCCPTTAKPAATINRMATLFAMSDLGTPRLRLNLE